MILTTMVLLRTAMITRGSDKNNEVQEGFSLPVMSTSPTTIWTIPYMTLLTAVMEHPHHRLKDPHIFRQYSIHIAAVCRRQITARPFIRRCLAWTVDWIVSTRMTFDMTGKIDASPCRYHASHDKLVGYYHLTLSTLNMYIPRYYHRRYYHHHVTSIIYSIIIIIIIIITYSSIDFDFLNTTGHVDTSSVVRRLVRFVQHPHHLRDAPRWRHRPKPPTELPLLGLTIDNWQLTPYLDYHPYLR